MFCFRARAERAVAVALVVVPSAILLPASHVLRHDQIGGYGGSWPGGGMGETRKESDRRGPTLIICHWSFSFLIFHLVVSGRIGPIGHIGPIGPITHQTRVESHKNPSALVVSCAKMARAEVAMSDSPVSPMD